MVIGISNIPVKTHSRDARPVVLIITHYFLIDRRGIRGGIGEHYVGLYGTFVKRFSKLYKVFWFSTDDSFLRTFDVNGNIKDLTKTSMPMAIIKVLNEARKSSEFVPPFTAIIAYYYAARKKPVSYVISMLFLHLLRMLSLVNVMVDIIDPPIEVHVTYSLSSSFKKILWGTVLDIVTLKKGTFMWFCSNSYQEYITKKYGIPYARTHVIYDGSVPDLITPKPPKANGQGLV